MDSNYPWLLLAYNCRLDSSFCFQNCNFWKINPDSKNHILKNQWFFKYLFLISIKKIWIILICGFFLIVGKFVKGNCHDSHRLLVTGSSNIPEWNWQTRVTRFGGTSIYSLQNAPWKYNNHVLRTRMSHWSIIDVIHRLFSSECPLKAY
jgi:hypothetical protein